MKALIYRKFGPPEVLEWVDDWPEPVLSSADVLVKTLAGGVNPKDVLVRKGSFPGFRAWMFPVKSWPSARRSMAFRSATVFLG
ncbi:MAG: hypothetical protein HZB24_01665 [Desulfobacterales bacterium]|nr:hypothetical protein [Desulfobacterales bacterium]